MKRRTLIFIIGAALAVGLAAVLYLVVWPRWLVEKQDVRILVSVTCPGMSAEESEALVLAKKHADRDLSMVQLDPRQALELRLIGNYLPSRPWGSRAGPSSWSVPIRTAWPHSG